MNTQPTKREREHLERVKSLPCSVCDMAAPSEAHHMSQSQVYTCVALCESCHRGPVMGWHGQRRAWLVRKMAELDALNVTIERLLK
jgi:hypothetical protein